MAPMSARILVAEDDPKLREVVRRYLAREGYAVDAVGDGRDAIDWARRRPPDLVVLDLMLPRVDGWNVCRVLRGESDVAILMLTARSSEDDLLLGLDLGADDYMTKPFSPPELVARVRTLLRRVRPAFGDDAPLAVGPLVVDRARHRVTIDNRHVACTAGEFKLLEVLARSPGRVFTRQQLLDRAHGVDSYITERTVDGHVKNLRKKLEADPGSPTLLLTVYGVGYTLRDPADDRAAP
jgi:DNA-binding response OmpR family regulator